MMEPANFAFLIPVAIVLWIGVAVMLYRERKK